MRNSLTYLTVLLSVLFGTAALADRSLAQNFAICTGRLSAEVEHSWLIETHEAEEKAMLYRNMEALLSAVTDTADANRTMALRIEAKAAHGHLLLQSAFGFDRTQRETAGARAEELIRLCTSLVLVSDDPSSLPVKWAGH